jgi:DNA-binding GntR family transcriptional regulator
MESRCAENDAKVVDNLRYAPVKVAFESLNPLTLETAPERIADQIRSAITNGSLAPGTQLTEVQLAERLAVSRGPVREAMQRLIQEGLLRAERHRGVFVIELGIDDVADIYLARRAIERAAAQELLARGAEIVVTTLEAIVAQMEAAVESGDWSTVVDADLHFHEVLVAGAQSKRLSRMYRTLIAETRMCITALKGRYPEWRELVVEHRALLDALHRGADGEVQELLASHLASGARNLASVAADPAG